jgi:hypothetical protein
MATPFVSCIMPTAERRRYVPHAIDYFLRQDYPERELIILDDGNDSVADLVPVDPRIRYLRETGRRTIGAKRNVCADASRGEVILHWDDDDWMAPDRISRQVAALAGSGADLTGCEALLFFDPANQTAWLYRYPGNDAAWVCGTSFCYRRDLWRRNPFPEIQVGEDSRFIWSAKGIKVTRLGEAGLIVALVHPHNTGSRRTQGSCWQRVPIETVRARLGEDWARYGDAERRDGVMAEARQATTANLRRSTSDTIVRLEPGPRAATQAAKFAGIGAQIANVYACLVHEKPECVIDLVRNLRAVDPVSPILLYDGSLHGGLLDPRLPWDRWGCERVADPRPMRWGALHRFALDCFAHLGHRDYDTVTIVDSDQLALRPGYAEYLARSLRDRSDLGLLSKSPERQLPGTREGPAAAALAEHSLWKPFLARFAGGEDKFVHWTFWPSTVIFADAARAMLDLFPDPRLQAILAASKLWATEEVLFPTLASLLGFRIAANPCRQDWVQFRRPYGPRDVAAALAAPEAFWLHPAPRRLDAPVRAQVRTALGGYRSAAAPQVPASPFPGQLWPVIAAMRAVPGWLADEEAELLLVAARAALSRPGACGRLVEVGAFCGKATLGLATVARDLGGRVVAIDPFDGVVGARDAKLERHGATRAPFDRMVAAHGLADVIDVRVGTASQCVPEGPCDLAVIDGLHDYAAVIEDFAALAPHLPPGAWVAFHDHADYFPGVVAVVEELMAGGAWVEEARADTMVLLRRNA